MPTKVDLYEIISDLAVQDCSVGAGFEVLS